MENLARECGVSRLTIWRDIQDLSREYPVFTSKGNGGGVYLADWFTIHQKYLSTYQQKGLEQILPKVDANDRAVIKSVLIDFARPGSFQKNCKAP